MQSVHKCSLSTLNLFMSRRHVNNLDSVCRFDVVMYKLTTKIIMKILHWQTILFIYVINKLESPFTCCFQYPAWNVSDWPWPFQFMGPFFYISTFLFHSCSCHIFKLLKITWLFLICWLVCIMLSLTVSMLGPPLHIIARLLINWNAICMHGQTEYCS